MSQSIGVITSITRRVQRLQLRLKEALAAHSTLQRLSRNMSRDNVGMLAGFVSWSILTSIIPLSVGVVAISSLLVESKSEQAEVVRELSRLFQGAVSTQDIETEVHNLSQSTGLLRIIGIGGVLWGASNIGGAFSTAFQIIFNARPRPFVREKLIDVGMLFVFTGLMVIILVGTTATAFLDTLASTLSFPALPDVVIVTAISLLSGFVLFGTLYTVFPNIEAGAKLRYVWVGALLAAVLFQIITTMWPLYVRLSHASRFDAVFSVLILLTAWIYAFAFILLLGAEVIAAASEDAVQEPAGQPAAELHATVTR